MYLRCPRGRLYRVLGGCGDVAAPGWGVPDQDAGFGLLQLPSFGLLTPMVMTAQRRVHFITMHVTSNAIRDRHTIEISALWRYPCPAIDRI